MRGRALRAWSVAALLAVPAGLAAHASRASSPPSAPVPLRRVTAETSLREQVRAVEIPEATWQSILSVARGFRTIPDADRGAYLDRELAPELSRWLSERAGGPEVSWIPEIRGGTILALNGVRVQKCENRVRSIAATGSARAEQVCYVRDRLVTGEEREYLRVW
jgi:hypothetical protein